ncbi:helicase-associated domain-containing protein [Microbacterium amylolyticum]|uniref:Helicase XPB/Ssl2 N-terminal domain-containing protein n=1 Tax=Microbacterium amylolyticum TaxID=936337 RepID=A0ABS4ZIX5_9MICO|nr:helicase-associated domain-containing protein [Microbacterium amylolyticum]MBP2437232.1 hypothetical protein [Microbacterium amylolyticum]
MIRVDGSAARMIAERLAAADDDALAGLFASRRLAPLAAPATTWRDFFDAAESLLQPEQIRLAVAALPRDTLAALASGEPRDLLALTDNDGKALPEVAAALVDIDLTTTPAGAPAAADDASSSYAAERAFSTISAIADIVFGSLARPLTRVASGALGASEKRRLVEQEIASDSEEADALVRLATHTGLMRGHDGHISTTSVGAAWVQKPTPRRWEMLAERFRDVLPAGLRDGNGWIDPALWSGAYPLDPEWPVTAERLLAFARLMGLLPPGHVPAETPWARPLREGKAADAGQLITLLPHEVDRLYLQNDLTAISPGPLAPHLDVRLRAMTQRESRAQASTYRFTERTIAAALSSGETADSIREFLNELSLTGVPQPLEYLIERTDDQHGLVRVSIAPDGGHTVISSPDHDMIRTLAVDQSLSSLALLPDGALLRTRATRNVAYWALTDARYPVVALDEDGDVIALNRHRLAPDPEPRAGFGELIERLRNSEGSDADAAWLKRELDSAVKDRAIIALEINMPDGSVRELTVEAAGLGGGRLRGRDAKADVERTLPVGLIRSMRRI